MPSLLYTTKSYCLYMNGITTKRYDTRFITFTSTVNFIEPIIDEKLTETFRNWAKMKQVDSPISTVLIRAVFIEPKPEVSFRDRLVLQDSHVRPSRGVGAPAIK